MLSIGRPSPAEIDAFLARAARASFSYDAVGASAAAERPPGFSVHHDHVRLGDGPGTFEAERAAVRAWRMFDIGWMSVQPEGAPIAVGTTVAVVAGHFGFWSLNAARIAYTIDEPRRFGFAYGTLPEHVERGEERFLVERRADDSVWYDLFAFSTPHHLLARLALPIGRAVQRRFARDSMRAMRRATTM